MLEPLTPILTSVHEVMHEIACLPVQCAKACSVMHLQGTVVTAGRARAVVVCTGPSTAMGKIRLQS